MKMDDEKWLREQLVHEVTDLRKQLKACERQAEDQQFLFEKKLLESEKRYRVIFDQSPTAMLVIDPESGAIVGANEATISFYGYTRHELIGKSISEIITLPNAEIEPMLRESMNGSCCAHIQNRLMNGTVRNIELSWGPINVNGSTHLLSIAHDITGRKAAEEAAREGASKLAAITSLAADAIILADDQGKVCYWNIAAEKMFGYDSSEMTGKTIETIMPTRFRTAHRHAFENFVESGHGAMVGKVYEVSGLRQDGSEFPIELSISGLLLKGKWHSAGVIRDITNRRNLEMQLHQAQKMEALGTLAGGVAHDYNNMLSVILAYSEMALEKLDPSHPIHDNLLEIRGAAVRSADITRQLLAFARKQTISPIVLDLNVFIGDMLKMLRRLIGENIDLTWLPGTGLRPVQIDPGQVNQILVNLCINAKDAIDGVGKITIETGMVTIDAAYCANHPGFNQGEYVLLTVSDDGCGMDSHTVGKIFEPFFTTKAVGQGTGLGLATVYGIVKQNGGFINVCSEPDNGTTVKIYLAHHSALTQNDPRMIPSVLVGHGETILVVEDEAVILKATKRLLEELGYTVLDSVSPSQALLLVEEHQGKIDLLVTDVVMPEMNGKELSERLHRVRPGLKTLFMSGYTADIIAHRGVLDGGINFIQKPFTKEKIAVKIQEALDR